MTSKVMKGVVSSGSINTSKAGAFAFENGGNAVDAAIAAQLAAFVCEPMLTGFGGAGLAMVRHNQQIYSVDMFTAMPGLGTGQHFSSDSLERVNLDFGNTVQSFVIGEGSIAVPTMPQGLFELHQQFGTLDLETLIQPAIGLARDGFIVSSSCAYILDLLMPIISTSSVLSKWYTKNNRALKMGERCYVREMVDDIQHFKQHGRNFFTEGVYQDSINSLHNCLLSKFDFDNYKINSLKVQPSKIRRVDCYTPNFPCVGGGILKQILQSPNNTVMDRVHALNTAYQTSLKELPSKILSYLGNTTHISTIDEKGNAVSLTSSLGETSGCVLENTGVIMNNFLGEADVAHPMLMNKLGQRLLTMCTPTIIESDRGIYVLGSGGSNRIPGAIAQVVQQLQSKNLEAAIGSSRIHTNIDGQSRNLVEILHEPLSDQDQSLLDAHFPNSRRKSFLAPNVYFGGVHVAAIESGELIGAGDLRRNGAVVIV